MLWQSCSILVSTCLWDIKHNAIVSTSIGRSVRCHRFPTVSAWVRRPVFHCNVRPQYVVLMWMGIRLVIALYQISCTFCKCGSHFITPYSGAEALVTVWPSPFCSPLLRSSMTGLWVWRFRRTCGWYWRHGCVRSFGLDWMSGLGPSRLNFCKLSRSLRGYLDCQSLFSHDLYCRSYFSGCP